LVRLSNAAVEPTAVDWLAAVLRPVGITLYAVSQPNLYVMGFRLDRLRIRLRLSAPCRWGGASRLASISSTMALRSLVDWFYRPVAID